MTSGPSRLSASHEPRGCILIVDDDQAIRETLRAALTDSGYDVEEAVDGQEAIDKMAGNTYQAVLLDLMMPNVNGQDVATLTQYFLDHEATRLIVMTARGRVDSSALYDAGVAQIIHKPFDLVEIERALEAS